MLSSLSVILTYVQTSMDTKVYLDMIRILTGSQKVEVLKSIYDTDNISK